MPPLCGSGLYQDNLRICGALLTPHSRLFLILLWKRPDWGECQRLLQLWAPKKVLEKSLLAGGAKPGFLGQRGRCVQLLLGILLLPWSFLLCSAPPGGQRQLGGPKAFL